MQAIANFRRFSNFFNGFQILWAESLVSLGIAEEIGKNHIKVIPDIIMNGGNGGSDNPISGLLGMQLLEMLEDKKNAKDIARVIAKEKENTKENTKDSSAEKGDK